MNTFLVSVEWLLMLQREAFVAKVLSRGGYQQWVSELESFAGPELVATWRERGLLPMADTLTRPQDVAAVPHAGATDDASSRVLPLNFPASAEETAVALRSASAVLLTLALGGPSNPELPSNHELATLAQTCRRLADRPAGPEAA